MNITSVKCPSCAANLSVPDTSNSMIYCQFCGATVYLETARNTGYDLEMGRREAIADTADNFVKILKDMKKPVLELPVDAQRLKNCNAEIEKYERLVKKYSKTSTPYKTPSIISGCVVLFLSMIQAPFIVFIIAALLCIGGYILSGQSCVKDLNRVQNRLDVCEREAETIKNAIDRNEAIVAKYPNVIIPLQYRTEKAFDYFINLFKSRQAFTLEEAYSRYSEVVKQDEALELQRKQIELQQKQIQEMQRMQRQMQVQNRRRR